MAEAQSIRIRGEALKDNARVIELTVAQRWTGQPPQTILGDRGAVPFFNLGQGASEPAKAGSAGALGQGSRPHPGPLQQARLGELATLCARIRKRMRMGERGQAAAPSLRGDAISGVPSPQRGEGQGEGALAARAGSSIRQQPNPTAPLSSRRVPRHRLARRFRPANRPNGRLAPHRKCGRAPDARGG